MDQTGSKGYDVLQLIDDLLNIFDHPKHGKKQKLKLMCWNINGVTSSIGSSKKRKSIVTEQIKKENPDIVFVVEPTQKYLDRHLGDEIPSSNGKRTKYSGLKYKNDEVYEYKGTVNESGFLFKSGLVTVFNHDDWFRIIQPRLNETGLIGTYRLCALNKRCFIMQSDQCIFISFHGRHKAKNSVRRKGVELLLYIMIWLNEFVGKPVVVGGDFNYDLLQEPLTIPKCICNESPKIHKYRTSKRYEVSGKRIIDYFVSFGDVSLQDVESIHLFESVANDKEKVELQLLLDHDPLRASINLQEIEFDDNLNYRKLI